jgi:hypothetical protein
MRHLQQVRVPSVFSFTEVNVTMLAIWPYAAHRIAHRHRIDLALVWVSLVSVSTACRRIAWQLPADAMATLFRIEIYVRKIAPSGNAEEWGLRRLLIGISKLYSTFILPQGGRRRCETGQTAELMFSVPALEGFGWRGSLNICCVAGPILP